MPKPDQLGEQPGETVALRPKHLPILDGEPPELVPARMINEVLYCERLFYLEWVQGEFAHNAFTTEGAILHETSAKPAGAPPDDPEQPFEARSLWLSSERLGITAKIDVLQGEGDGVVVPIEHKRGQAPDIPEGAYLPERAQLCAQAMLLRDHGYRVDEGAIWFAKSRKRVTIRIDDELVRITREAVLRAKQLARKTKAPPPLSGDDARKCQGCSLVGICLPDEVSLFAQTEEIEARQAAEVDPPPIRRLVTPRDDRRAVYVQEQGARLGVDGERLVMTTKEGKAEARLPNTSHVAVFGNVQVSTQCVRALFERKIPLLYFSYGGWFLGRTVGLDSGNVGLRVAQVEAAKDEAVCLRLARAFVAAKIRNGRTLIRRNHPSPDPVLLGHLETLARKAEDADAIDSLLGIEGTAARAYFEGFAGMLKESRGFELDGRNRRPPRDPVNALLSFAYSLLTKDCTVAVTAAGLDPMLGFFHRPRFGRPALALDMMEEMRPVIADSVVLGVVNNGVVDPDDFLMHKTGVALKAPARKRFIVAYERRLDQEVTHPIFGYKLSYRRLLEVQARLVARLVEGEIDRYTAFRVR